MGRPGLRGAPVLAATLRERWDEVLLYRILARLRTADDGVEIPQQSLEELRWHGRRRAGWEAFCDELGLDRQRGRPHRWVRLTARLASAADEGEQRRVVGRRAPRACRSSGAWREMSNQGRRRIRHGGAAPLGDETRRCDVP